MNQSEKRGMQNKTEVESHSRMLTNIDQNSHQSFITDKSKTREINTHTDMAWKKTSLKSLSNNHKSRWK